MSGFPTLPWGSALASRLALVHAQRLDLRGLGITWGVWHTNEARLFEPFENLEEIDLSHNNIDVVCLPFGKLPKLRWLDLSHNDLGYWGSTDQCPLDKLGGSSLRELNVSHNELGYVRLTASAPFATGLRELDISFNTFPTFYDSLRSSLRPELRICSLKRLVTLRSRGNLLREVPKLGRFPALRELDLGENPLRCNFQHLLALPNLATLLLDRLGLARVPRALFELKHLRCLDLSGNPLPSTETRRLRQALPGVTLRLT